MKLYIQYSTNYEKAIKKLAKCMELRPQLREWLAVLLPKL